MKKIFIASFAAMALASCSSAESAEKAEGTDSTATTSENTYKAGEEITEEGALTSADLMTALEGKDSLEVKLTSKVEAVCQVKGCWMQLNMGDKEPMRVTFKDYAFFVPKDATGKTAVVDGWIKKETISVEHQRHLAEDAGKSQEEIEAITEPKTEMTFEAKGVIIK